MSEPERIAAEQPAGAARQPARPSRRRESRPLARHGRQQRRSPWKGALAVVGGALAVVLVAAGGTAGVAIWQLQSNIDQQTIGSDAIPLPPMVGPYEGGFDLLIVGSDTGAGQGALGEGRSGELNDVNLLLHVSEDQRSATLVSFPRDLVVPIPACSNGGPATAQPINVTLSYGGLDCTVRTVEALTGLTIEFAGLITFRGVISMSNAVGGVEVCTTGPIRDPESGLDIESAGTHVLKGSSALKFLRARKHVGDGSDLSRISTQQVYLSSLVRKIKSEDTLGDPGTIYSLAQAATQNMTLSRNLARLDVLASLSLVLKDIPLDRIVMVQYPGRTGVTSPAYYVNKVVPLQAQAEALFAAIREDRPIALDEEALENRGAVTLDPNAPDPEETPAPDPSGSPAPEPPPGEEPVTVSGVKGQSADQRTCVVGS